MLPLETLFDYCTKGFGNVIYGYRVSDSMDNKVGEINTYKHVPNINKRKIHGPQECGLNIHQAKGHSSIGKSTHKMVKVVFNTSLGSILPLL